jgi:hypothetical protein
MKKTKLHTIQKFMTVSMLAALATPIVANAEGAIESSAVVEEVSSTTAEPTSVESAVETSVVESSESVASESTASDASTTESLPDTTTEPSESESVGPESSVLDATSTEEVSESSVSEAPISTEEASVESSSSSLLVRKNRLLGKTRETSASDVTTTESSSAEAEEVVEEPKVVIEACQVMYRLYNKNSGEHFYTRARAEADKLVKLGWRDEGIGWYAPKSGDPVYRMYNKNAGDHHYTLSTNERDKLVKAGWKYEGIGWYSSKLKSVPIYRAYNKNAKAGSHNYTASAYEQKVLIKAGWINENIGWYGSTPAVEGTSAVNNYIMEQAIAPAGETLRLGGITMQSKYDLKYTGGKPTVVIIHESANNTSTIENEITYMTRNQESAFVHSWVDGSKLITIADTARNCWGSGAWGNRYGIQIEQTRVHSKAEFAKQIATLANWTANQMIKYKMGTPRLNTTTEKTDYKKFNGNLMSHEMVSRQWGGTDHTDPVWYWQDRGVNYFGQAYDMNQFLNLVKYYYNMK